MIEKIPNPVHNRHFEVERIHAHLKRYRNSTIHPINKAVVSDMGDRFIVTVNMGHRTNTYTVDDLENLKQVSGLY